jgi:hypothetical protein
LDENQEMQMETPARRPTGHLEVDVVSEKLDASKDDSEISTARILPLLRRIIGVS